MPSLAKATLAASVIFCSAQAHAAGGWYTNCYVNMSDGSQIAVVNAKSNPTCISAAKKCIRGRAYTTIEFTTNLVLQSSDTIELCQASY